MADNPSNQKVNTAAPASAGKPGVAPQAGQSQGAQNQPQPAAPTDSTKAVDQKAPTKAEKAPKQKQQADPKKTMLSVLVALLALFNLSVLGVIVYIMVLNSETPAQPTARELGVEAVNINNFEIAIEQFNIRNGGQDPTNPPVFDNVTDPFRLDNETPSEVPLP